MDALLRLVPLPHCKQHNKPTNEVNQEERRLNNQNANWALLNPSQKQILKHDTMNLIPI